jgi:RNA recognition motif-containing protein
MSRANYSAGKRERDAEKAQRLVEKAERRALKRARGPRPKEFTTLEAVVGNMPTPEQAMRRMALRDSSAREVAPLPCRLYVGGLSYDTRDETLRRAFEQHGPVAEAVIVQDRSTGKSRGFGFVTMVNRKDATKTIAALDGSDLDGRSLVVRVATDR